MPASELNIDTSASAMDMANSMFGDGVSVVNATYTGSGSASGVYSGGDATSDTLTPADGGVILSTGNVTDITNSSGSENTSAGTGTDHSLAGDAGLTGIAGVQTFDAAIFEANFVPVGDTLSMQLVFSSEEYLEYVNSGYSDSVGVWVNGTQAKLSLGDSDISIDSINNVSNSNLYVDNPASAATINTEMDGLTITLTLKAPVIAGATNTIKIGIADGGDGGYDSNLLIAGDSLQTTLIARDDEVDLRGTNAKTIDVLGNDESSDPSLTITQINGQDVVPGQTVVLPAGETITLNADGTLTIQSDGTLGADSFTYQVTDSSGNTDVAFVTANTLTACFTAGSLILTLLGSVPIETVSSGDQILTRDHGYQPVRWIGLSKLRPTPKDRPITLHRNALGQHDAISLSPNHRALLTDSTAELLFGQSEVLVKAKDLLNGDTITQSLNNEQ